MPRPRILHVVSPVRQGGGESLLITLLSDPGTVPLLALMYRSAPFEASLTRLGIRWIPLTRGSLGDGATRLGILLRAPMSVVGAFRLARLVRREMPDVVHVHSFPATFWIAAMKALGIIDVATIMTRHSLFATRTWVTRRPFAWMMWTYDRITTVSQSSARQIRQTHPDLRVDVIHNCVADTFFDVPDPPPGSGRVTFLQLGRFVPDKNHALVLEALSSLMPQERAGICVWFAGAGETESAIRDLAAELGLSPAEVRFLGYVPHEQVPEIMAQVHFGLFPSRKEGFGIGAAECLASGRPVLALDTDVMQEVIGSAGMCVPEDQLADGLRAMLRLGPEASTAARHWARRYAPSVATAAYITLYRDVLGQAQ